MSLFYNPSVQILVSKLRNVLIILRNIKVFPVVVSPAAEVVSAAVVVTPSVVVVTGALVGGIVSYVFSGWLDKA